MHLKSLIWVFLGSGLGGCVRWWFGTLSAVLQLKTFPWSTFAANVIACAISGGIGAWLSAKCDSDRVTLFWLVGFCGGFSTMSAFTREWLQLIQSGSMLLVVYPLTTLVACIVATYAGALCVNYLAS